MAHGHAEHLAPAVGVDADGDDDGDRDDLVVAPDLHVGGVQPDIGPVALDRTVEEGVHTLIYLATEPRHLALADPLHAHRLDQVIDGAGGDALDVGLLDDSRQGLLRHATRLEEGRKVAAAAQLGNAQLDGACPGFPISLAVAVALIGPSGAALARCSPAGRLGLQLHEALGGKADHLAQECRVGAFLQQRAKGSLVIGHRGGPRVQVVSRQPNPTQDHHGGC